MEKAKYRAYICGGPNCAPKGSLSLVDFLEAELQRQELTRLVSTNATGCQAHCESGPTMVVYPGPVYYQSVDQERLLRIIREHFLGDRPVEEYFWHGVRRRILADGSVISPRRVNAPEDARLSTAVEPRGERPPKARKPAPEVDDFKW